LHLKVVHRKKERNGGCETSSFFFVSRKDIVHDCHACSYTSFTRENGAKKKLMKRKKRKMHNENEAKREKAAADDRSSETLLTN